MRKKYSEYLKMCLWFLLVVEILILVLAIIFGHSCGYRNSFIAFGIVGALLFMSATGILVLLKLVDTAIDKTDTMRR